MDVLLRQILKGIHFVYGFLKDLVEEIADPSTSLTLCGNVLDKVSIQTFLVFFEELVDENEDERSHRLRVEVGQLGIVRE